MGISAMWNTMKNLTSSRIWTRVTVSISYDDNHYTTGTSTKSFNCVQKELIVLLIK